MPIGLLLSLALIAQDAPAQDAPPASPAESSAAAAADHFSLDLPATEDPPPPVSLDAPASAPSDAPSPAAAGDSVATGADAAVSETAGDVALAPVTPFSLDTPIADLIASPRAKAVLDKDLPGLSDDSNLARFESMSLRQFQPQTGGQLTDALLQSTGDDLAAIPAAAPPHRHDLQTGR